MLKNNKPLQNPLFIIVSGNKIVEHMQYDNYGKLHITGEIGGIARAEDGTIKQW